MYTSGSRRAQWVRIPPDLFCHDTSSIYIRKSLYLSNYQRYFGTLVLSVEIVSNWGRRQGLLTGFHVTIDVDFQSDPALAERFGAVRGCFALRALERLNPSDHGPKVKKEMTAQRDAKRPSRQKPLGSMNPLGFGSLGIDLECTLPTLQHRLDFPIC